MIKYQQSWAKKPLRILFFCRFYGSRSGLFLPMNMELSGIFHKKNTQPIHHLPSL